MTITNDENLFELEAVDHAPDLNLESEPPVPSPWESEKSTLKETLLALLSNYEIDGIESRVDAFLTSLESPVAGEPLDVETFVDATLSSIEASESESPPAEELPETEAPPAEETAEPTQPHAPSGVAGSTHAMVYKVQ